MPLEQTELSEEEKKKQLEQQTNSFGGQTIGAGAGAEIQPSTLGSAPSASRLSPVTPQTPTQSFGTIQDYFKGSREQGERFGEQFTGKLAETQQQQRGAIGQAATGTAQDISAGTVGYDPGLISRAVADPTKVAGDEGQFEDFLKQWNAQYKGPQTFEGSTQYGQAAKAAQEAQAKAAQLGTTGGRQQLIQEEFGVYGQGKKGLDEALLQQSSFFPKVQEQTKGFRSLQDYLKAQSQDIGSQAQAAKATTAATQQQARSALDPLAPEIESNISKQFKEAEQSREQYNKSVREAEESLRPLGKTFSGYSPGYKDVMSDYIGDLSIDAPTISSTTTPEQAARLKALEKLTGRPMDIDLEGKADIGSYIKSEDALRVNDKKVKTYQDRGMSPEQAKKAVVAEDLTTRAMIAAETNLLQRVPFLRKYFRQSASDNPKAFFNTLSDLITHPQIRTHPDWSRELPRIANFMDRLVKDVPELFKKVDSNIGQVRRWK